jgi:mono/diheme cytochrome c family protein
MIHSLFRAFTILLAFMWVRPTLAADTAIERGEYLLRAAGCLSCHTDVKNDGPPLSGGRSLKTAFGTFYSPNITPDAKTGIGTWTDEEFVRALRHGVRPDGAHYFPVFPYPSYARMTKADMLDLKAYLFSLAPVRRNVPEHEVPFPFSWRFLQIGWKILFFSSREYVADNAFDTEWNRGAYLVRALAHCGECHTPRNIFGAPKEDFFHAGTPDGPDGELVPNITPDSQTGIGDWSKSDLVRLLKSGLKPDFDDVQGSMYEAIEHGLKFLRDDDLEAIAGYILSLDPVLNQVAMEE